MIIAKRKIFQKNCARSSIQEGIRLQDIIVYASEKQVSIAVRISMRTKRSFPFPPSFFLLQEPPSSAMPWQARHCINVSAAASHHQTTQWRAAAVGCSPFT